MMENLQKEVHMDEIDLDKAVPESTMHLDMELEREEKKQREMAKKMQNAEYFPYEQYCLLYLQTYILENGEIMELVYKCIDRLGITIMNDKMTKLGEGEPDHLLEGSGRENQAPKYINQPARLFLISGDECHQKLKTGLVQDEIIEQVEKLHLELFQGGDKGLLVGGGSHRYLKLVQVYFYDYADKLIKRNVLRKAFKLLLIFVGKPEEETTKISTKVHATGIEIVEEVHKHMLDETTILQLAGSNDALKEQLSQEVSIFGLRCVKEKINKDKFQLCEPVYVSDDEEIVHLVFPKFGDTESDSKMLENETNTSNREE